MRRRISRRSFLKDCSKGVAAAAVAPYLLGPAVKPVLAGQIPQDMALGDFYEHFMIDQEIIRRVMSEALSRGGDYCDLFFEHTISNYIGLEDGSVNRAYGDVDFGVGIRVLKGDQTGYSFSEEITPEAMRLAARTAANIASGAKEVAPVGLTLKKHPNHYPIEVPWEEIGIDDKIPYLQLVNDEIFKCDPRVVKATIWFSDRTSYVLVATSDGRIAHDYRPLALIYATCVAEQEGQREENMFASSGRVGMEYFTAKRAAHVATETVRRTVDLFDAVKPEAGEMEVVLAPGGSGILLHEAIGHGMEADFNRKGESIYADKIGKAVAEPFVTIVDDGTDLNARGSLNIDDEGNATERTYLVEDGILRSYMHDHISAKHYGVRPTGNGRRQSFRYAPQPRMRNTYMLRGPHSREEIIRSVDKGLYAEHFSNGEVRIGPGDFTFYVKSGYMIEAGEITRAVKDVNIIGNGPEVLTRIVMVADDLEICEGGGNCGKGGQYVPVTDGLPTVKVSKITVGGISS